MTNDQPVPQEAGLKKDIRQKLLKVRKNIPKELRVSKNKKIIERLDKLNVFRNAQHILFYYSFNNEVDTINLISKYLDEKKLYLPLITSATKFKAVPIQNLLDLKTGSSGALEPIDTGDVYEDKIELVITPGVSFDVSGNRIGMGKGYYDRYFEHNSSSVKIALAYEEQILDSIPKDPYDVPVDIIVTDQKIYQL